MATEQMGEHSGEDRERASLQITPSGHQEDEAVGSVGSDLSHTVQSHIRVPVNLCVGLPKPGKGKQNLACDSHSQGSL